MRAVGLRQLRDMLMVPACVEVTRMSSKKISAQANEAKGAHQNEHANFNPDSPVIDTGWLSIGRGYSVRFSGVPGLAMVNATWRPRVPRSLPRLVKSRRYKAALSAFEVALRTEVPR
ncbi:MAG TPA: hypothetical protein PKE15_00355 [Ottowia sp.]|nr:hypothetical protein [Ottowia sp.]